MISLLHKGQIVLDLGNPIQVSISQFYGIEINDFAVTVAKTALWIAESQMMKETEDVVHMALDFLPLKTNAYIVEGNALRQDWETVVPKGQLCAQQHESYYHHGGIFLINGAGNAVKGNCGLFRPVGGGEHGLRAENTGT